MGNKPLTDVRKISPTFMRMSKLYYHFAKDWENCVKFDDQSLLDAYNKETYGTPVSEDNGFVHGKSWLNVTVTMWKEDLAKGGLFLWELYQDDAFPHWWLDDVFKKELAKNNRLRMQMIVARWLISKREQELKQLIEA